MDKHNFYVVLDMENDEDIKIYRYLKTKECKSKFIKKLIWKRMGEKDSDYSCDILYAKPYSKNRRRNISIPLQLIKSQDLKIYNYIKDKDNQSKFIRRLILEEMTNEDWE